MARPEIAPIMNAAWWVRYYGPKKTLKRQQAIQKLGLAVKAALSSSDDYEAIIRAVVDGVNPQDYAPF